MSVFGTHVLIPIAAKFIAVVRVSVSMDVSIIKVVRIVKVVRVISVVGVMSIVRVVRVLILAIYKKTVINMCCRAARWDLLTFVVRGVSARVAAVLFIFNAKFIDFFIPIIIFAAVRVIHTYVRAGSLRFRFVSDERILSWQKWRRVPIWWEWHRVLPLRYLE